MDFILNGLNKEQYKAVTHTDGPLLVLAGAGSGKTRVITHRFAYLLKEKQINVQNILAVTFTNKAANEMKERIAHLTNQNVTDAWIRTFHSMGAKILRQHANLLDYDRNFVIYDDTDSKDLVKGIIKDLDIDTDTYSHKAIASAIFKEKNSLVYPNALINKIDELDEAKSEFQKIMVQVYEHYQNLLKKNNAMDFMDLIGLQVKLFRNYPDLRKKYHNLWHYVMIDEFQDTNSAQYMLTKLIVNPDCNICVVGDDDQSIYGWRGADISNIYDFRDTFKPTVIALEQNYRSTSIILEAANKVVQRIPNRMKKKLWTDHKSKDKIKLIKSWTPREEAALVVTEIQQLSSLYDYKDFAIFYRTNAQSLMFEQTLLQLRIPYKIFGGHKFYERKEIKDVLAYIRIVVNPMDSIAFDRIVNIPKRKVGDRTKQKIITYATSKHLNLIEAIADCDNITGIQNGVRMSLKNLAQILAELHESVNKISPLSFINILLEAINYRKYIIKYDQDGKDRWANVGELINSIRNFQDSRLDAKIADFLNEISLETPTDNLDGDEKRNYVSLMTIHNAKGLEFPVVFITGVVDGLIPLHFSGKINDENSENEERRLFYVAITRAKELLFISYSENSMVFGEFVPSEFSCFLYDIPENLIEKFDVNETVVVSNKKKKTTRYHGSNNTKEKKQKSDKKVKIRKLKIKKINNMSDSDLQSNVKGKAVTSITELSVGDSVTHTMFGTGKVTFVSDKIIKVIFDRVGYQILSVNQLSSLVKPEG